MGRMLAYAMFGIGILVSVAGAAKLPADGDTYPDTLGAWALGVVLGIAGIVLWRYVIGQEKQKTNGSEASGVDHATEALSLLERLVPPGRQLQAESEKLNEHDLAQRVDALLEQYVLPFADLRQSLIDRFGMAKGAEILVTVAYAERMLNRVWSAASDGHLPEARASLPEALDAFEEANQLAAKAA